LFVGESDFSTLEKVRNVEILPPSTYNRKIPDELERIVLKALAKDVEDRYQNAIDLHDELQAFVYTAGEFYSRKDLAGWMKKTFGKEIEEETAKLESYRQLKPPAPEVPAIPRTSTGERRVTAGISTPPPVRRATAAMPSMAPAGTKPPPPPARASGQMPVIPADAKPKYEDSGALSWDDDELETQIYDNPEDDPKNKALAAKAAAAKAAIPLVAAATPPPPAEPSPAATVRGVPAAAAASEGPDLSSLVSTAKGWESGHHGGPPPPSPAATLNGIGGIGTNGTPAFASGSNKAVAPLPPAASAPLLFETGPRETSAPARLVSSSETFDPMSTFGSGMLKNKGDSKKGILLIAVGGAALAAVAVVVIIAMSGGKKDTATTAENPTSPAPNATNSTNPGVPQTGTPPAQTAVGDQNTGFDLYVQPSGITNWKLDGEARTDRLPSRIRGIAPGTHNVQIDPPAGFMSQNQQVIVEAGKAPRVDIQLQPIAGIHGVFESTPPGATVSLIVDGKRETLGPSPAKAPLDPRQTYQVLFEKPGYVSVNKPIVFSGNLEEKMVVPMEKAGGAAVAVAPKIDTKPDTKPDTKVETPIKTPPDKTGPVTKITDTKPDKTTPPKGTDTKIEKPDGGEKPVGNETPKVADTKPKGMGTLMLGSKPSCEIYIDGSNSGLHTPQREIKLAAGKHRITLMNNEFGIKETFVVEIKPDETAKAIKDYSDRLPK
ncbi:MAG: hypothetical protein JNL83_15350, partial [Myxococcales bacterium]|nr:hypothetical protein [Myxococcales bacterium]